MLNKKLLTASATVIAVLLALAGCSTEPSGTSPTAGSSMPAMHPEGGGMMSGTAPAATAEHTAADTKFIQSMIPHHEQAVKMSEIMLQKKDLPASITDLATKIKAAQAPEIEMMTGLLKSWNESPTMGAGHSMEGLMGEDDLKELEATQGTDAAKVFLRQMIAHHEGAVKAAKAETAQGTNPDAVRLSEDIVTAQEAEIKEMQDLSGKLGPA